MSVIGSPFLPSPASISRIQREFRACNDWPVWTERQPAIVIDSFKCLLSTYFDQPGYDARKIPMKTARSSLQARIPM
jgi:hypothetical protein